MKLVEDYREIFHIHPADTDSDRESSYHIRYQVYCQELGYEQMPEDMKEREVDEYDMQSRHCLLVHTASKRPIGCARLVLVDPQHPEHPLPFWKNCPQAVDTNKFDPTSFKPGQLAEFSRIAIIEQFRRREKAKSSNQNPKASIMYDRRLINFPVIPICLFLAPLSMLIKSEAEYGVALMERKLVRLLRQYGIMFESIGKTVEYRGMRGPYVIHRDNVLLNLTSEVKDLFLEIHQGL
jgi:N-acyl amino acid synthase of PEP-CTERM/exosortase system